MKVSIVIPTYNSQKFIASALDSIMSQSYEDIECIVQDGGSKDGTYQIVESYRKKYGDKIIFISEKDKGVFDALNKGIKAAAGEVIGWMGSDDFYSNNNVVARAVCELEEKKVDMCWGDLLYVEQENPDKIVRYWQSSKYKFGDYQHGWQLPHFSSFLQKKVFGACGYFREDLKIAADYEFFLRVLEIHQTSSSYIPEVFLKMRLGGQSNLSLKGNMECYKAWELNNLHVNPISVFLPKIFVKFKQYINKP